MWLDITENDRMLARFLTMALVVASLFLYLFAIRGIILHRLSAIKGVGHGWHVVRHNLGRIVLFTLPFLLLYLLLRLAISGAFSPLFWRYLLFFVLIFVFSTLLNGVLTAWQSATFTLAYLQWTGKDVLGEQAAPPPAPLM